MDARILVKGLGMLALISSLASLGIALGHAGEETRGIPRFPTPSARALADSKLAAEARHIDRNAVGGTLVARFLGAEFGMSEDAVLAQKESLGASWGNLTIAHTLAASDKPGMSVAQVLQLHERGMGWGQVAAGLGFNLGNAIRAVNEESRVARGSTKADGRVAPIRGYGF